MYFFNFITAIDYNIYQSICQPISDYLCICNIFINNLLSFYQWHVTAIIERGDMLMDINIGERIGYFRSLKGYTVNKLANLSGVSQSYLRDIELGKNTNPGLDVLDCLCTALDITLKDLFDDSLSSAIDSDPLIACIYKLSESKRKALLQLLSEN